MGVGGTREFWQKTNVANFLNTSLLNDHPGNRSIAIMFILSLSWKRSKKGQSLVFLSTWWRRGAATLFQPTSKADIIFTQFVSLPPLTAVLTFQSGSRSKIWRKSSQSQKIVGGSPSSTGPFQGSSAFIKCISWNGRVITMTPKTRKNQILHVIQ